MEDSLYKASNNDKKRSFLCFIIVLFLYDAIYCEQWEHFNGRQK